MKGVQDNKRHKKKQDLQVLAPFPGCLGRVINMFDLSSGVVATKMLTEKAHRDGTKFSYTFTSKLQAILFLQKFACSLAYYAWFSTKDLIQCSMRLAVSPAGKDRSNSTFKMAINPPVQTEDKQVLCQ